MRAMEPVLPASLVLLLLARITPAADPLFPRGELFPLGAPALWVAV